MARRLLQDRLLSASRVIGIGYALLALNRFPNAVQVMHVEIGISYSFNNEDFREGKDIHFGFFEPLIEVIRGGSVFEKGIGHDSFSLPGWSIDVESGFRSIGCDLTMIEEGIESLLHLGTTIHVSNESERLICN